ncbi:class I SAM-dependent methyltransferase [Coprococcus ammoniilyticus]|jgi:O-methyltransferase involved in polyketide biosynthesis|uniref:Class I SAM-dependent methyltransferase n=1 Tax=Coprococcus ammoniilyticus TaxID=2981785 RepID=A0ABV1EDD9_9FIRM
MEKIKIEKGTVQETLLIPLYGRKYAMDLYPDLFMDHDCQALFDRIDFTVPDNMKGMLGNIGCIMGATRQYDMASACRAYLKAHPNACVVNLGCGLDTTFRQVDNGKAKGYNLDFPDTIAIRNELLGTREREFNIACDLNDISWFDQIDFRPEDGIVFFASGVFYYFKMTDVEKLFAAMAEHFPGGKLVFDATKKKGLKSMLKTWLKGFEMKDINVYFSVDDVHTLKEWSGHISSAVSNPYLTGYRPLDKRYGFITNIVFRYLDRSKMCQIIELKFD